MGRILAIDYGTKRVGLAVTDPLQMIANPLTTVHSKDVVQFLKDYTTREEVDCFVIGEPRRWNNEASGPVEQIDAFIRSLSKNLPGIRIERMDERFTSKMAFQAMLDAGLKKKDRGKKELVDMISATIILQSYLDMKSNEQTRT
jgi:putative Holliday junction resolvase